MTSITYELSEKASELSERPYELSEKASPAGGGASFCYVHKEHLLGEF